VRSGLVAEYTTAYADCFAATLGIPNKAGVAGDPEFRETAERAKRAKGSVQKPS